MIGGLWMNIKGYIVVALLSQTLAALPTYFIQNKKVEQAKIEVAEWKNNAYAISNNNTVLTGKYDDILQINDSLINSLESTRKELGISKKDLKQATQVISTFRDSINFLVNRKPIVDLPIFKGFTEQERKELEIELLHYCDFDTIHRSNEYTMYDIKMLANEFTLVEEIRNELDILIPERKKWVNPDKNIFQRIFTWDWKKDYVDEVKVKQYNDLITIDDIRVIKYKN